MEQKKTIAILEDEWCKLNQIKTMYQFDTLQETVGFLIAYFAKKEKIGFVVPLENYSKKKQLAIKQFAKGIKEDGK